METLVRNKLIIIPQAKTAEEYNKQLCEVGDYCEAIENGTKKVVLSFAKIAPKPTNLKPESKEEDDWLLNNWGTRNRAFNSCWISDNEIIFDTFWNPAVPIFIKLVKQFPNISFEFNFASKRIGTKAGTISAAHGKITLFKRFKAFSREAYEMAFELMPHQRAFYTLNMRTDEYEYDTSDFKAVIGKEGFYRDSDGSVLIGCDDKKKPLFDTADDLPF